MTTRLQITIDCADPVGQAAFWATAILGALAGPAARLEILFEYLDRRAVVTLVVISLSGQGLAPFDGLAFGAGTLVPMTKTTSSSTPSRVQRSARTVALCSNTRFLRIGP